MIPKGEIMKHHRYGILAFSFCLLCSTTIVGDDAPVPIVAKGENAPRVLSIQRIWSQGPHNAFPDVEYFRGKWYVATREGTAHGISGFGKVRIIASDDTKNWQSVALFEGFGDYRRAELSVTSDGKLMVVSKFNYYGKPGKDQKRTFAAKDFRGKVHNVISQAFENRVAFSGDGKTWTKLQKGKGTQPRAWFYSGVQWYKGVGYAIDRQGRQLYKTRDGVLFEKVSEVPVGNESRIAFLPNGNMIVFFRNGSLATSPAPYEKWTLNETNKKGPHSYCGPGIIALPDGDVLTASRHRIEPKDFVWPDGENVFPDGTVLFRLQGKQLVPKLLIRGGGDRGYNGLVWRDGFLWMAYNAPSGKAGNCCI